MPFEISEKWGSYHLIPQSVDVALNPPESYFFVTDFLIIACGILYTLCYMFYTIRTYSDRFVAGTVQFLSATMAYEIYYAYVCTTTTFQRACFFVWFLFDITFVTVALKYAYKPGERGRTIIKLLWQTPAWMVFLWYVGTVWPDEREQKTAFFTGLYLELPIGWGQILYLVQRQDTKGQSLEIWITRYLGCITAFLVFIWRYVNVPENWSYVGNWWSIGGMIVTLLPEMVYPFFYVWAHRKEREKKVKAA
ncbi:Amino acid transporter [Stemphylium lycopersici]|uniref:Amino acid transporter n=1 Tax=Stemphylium lycopersici TaxID=183478 RepID=A0A364NC83_STELY|nr:Amino acid transporter [Stemphylium lycopersici]RAR14876.1 Amino acid transporter [Stemphylium lycopersici]